MGSFEVLTAIICGKYRLIDDVCVTEATLFTASYICFTHVKEGLVLTHMTKAERDELCVTLTAAQESAIVQLLLEICLLTEEDKEV